MQLPRDSSELLTPKASLLDHLQRGSGYRSSQTVRLIRVNTIPIHHYRNSRTAMIAGITDTSVPARDRLPRQTNLVTLHASDDNNDEHESETPLDG